MLQRKKVSVSVSMFDDTYLELKKIKDTIGRDTWPVFLEKVFRLAINSYYNNNRRTKLSLDTLLKDFV